MNVQEQVSEIIKVIMNSELIEQFQTLKFEKVTFEVVFYAVENTPGAILYGFK